MNVNTDLNGWWRHTTVMRQFFFFFNQLFYSTTLFFRFVWEDGPHGGAAVYEHLQPEEGWDCEQTGGNDEGGHQPLQRVRSAVFVPPVHVSDYADAIIFPWTCPWVPVSACMGGFIKNS